MKVFGGSQEPFFKKGPEPPEAFSPQDRGLNESYQYDEKGRRMSEICGARGIFSKRYQYTFDNRLFAAGNTFYEHDEDGFRSSREENGQTTRYRYSPDGRLLQAELPDGTVIRYRHHNGQRVAKLVNGRTTEAYQWLDRIRLGAAMVDGVPMQFHYDSGRLPIAMTHDGVTYSLHYDQVGSLRVVVDSTGNVIKEISYTSFGNILNDSNPAFKVPRLKTIRFVKSGQMRGARGKQYRSVFFNT